MTRALASIDSTSPAVIEARDELLRRILQFCRLLRTAGLSFTPGRLIDVVRSLRSIDLLEPDSFRWALRVNLVGSRDEEKLFDRLFDAFWRSATEVREVPTEFEMEERQDDRNLEYPEEPPDVRSTPMQWSPDEVTRDVDLQARFAELGPDLDRLIRELAQKLATRPSRRRQPSARGRQIDLRRSLRRNLRHGMDLVELRRTRRRTRRTRLVLLCDVSGSMDSYNPLLLNLMFGLQKRLSSSRTVVFSTRSTEVTTLLRQHSVGRTLREISRSARHWSGGTDIGAALATLNRKILREGAPSSTIAIVLSDGYDQGDATRVALEMRALRRRVRKIVWINPLLGSHGYAPIAKGMRAALPFVDHFLPAHDVGSLRLLCRDLARV